MTTPLGSGGQPTDQQALVATHFAYNIGRGMAILVDKWNSAPLLAADRRHRHQRRPAPHRELVLRGLELQRLHRPRRQPQQPPARPDLRRLAAHAVQLRPRERRPRPQPQPLSLPGAGVRLRRASSGRERRAALAGGPGDAPRPQQSLLARADGPRELPVAVHEDGHPDAEAAAHRPDRAGNAR